jgi:nitroreductase
MSEDTQAATRTPEAEVDAQFPGRVSPYGFSGADMSEAQLRSLLEAVKWAPSAFNEQPWRYIYARKGTAAWSKLFGLLVEPNQKWAQATGALFVIVSKKTFSRNEKPNGTHSYDTGASWMSLALQASRMGLAAHGMAGFDYERARTELGIPDDYHVEAMAAVGEPVAEQPKGPSLRKGFAEIAFEGAWAE